MAGIKIGDENVKSILMTFKVNRHERNTIALVCKKTGKSKSRLIREFFENCIKNENFVDIN